MSTPVPAPAAPALEAFGPVATALLGTGLVNDPWFEGVPRFAIDPFVLTPERLERLHLATEAVLRLHAEATDLVRQRPELLDFLGLTPVQRLIWRAGGPEWHGYARADCFELEGGGIAICEVNSDTPTGHAEAVALNQAIQPFLDGMPGRDPNADCGDRITALVDTWLQSLPDGAPRTAAIVYPTEMAEDLGVVLLFQRWLESAGLHVVLGSPFNLGVDPTGQPTLLGEPFGLLLRHYKTDWWSERLPVWEDEPPFEDPTPLARELQIVLEAEASGRIVTVNPFGAVVPQNKRIMALMWERLDLFSDPSREDIRRYVPETVRMESMHPEQLMAEREDWVLKSDYGCEGDEVVIGVHISQDEWDKSVRLAVEGRWVAQRRFVAKPFADGRDVNWGIFAVAGVPHGCYARVQQGTTDWTALTVPVFVSSPDEEE